jgi:hypothetical protein
MTQLQTIDNFILYITSASSSQDDLFDEPMTFTPRQLYDLADVYSKQESSNDKIHVCTHFLGTTADVDDFTFEWMSLLGSPVTAELKKDSMGAVKAWYCEAFVTKDQIESFDMKSDWIINN